MNEVNQMDVVVAMKQRMLTRKVEQSPDGTTKIIREVSSDLLTAYVKTIGCVGKPGFDEAVKDFEALLVKEAK